jgi:hypothetical protein
MPIAAAPTPLRRPAGSRHRHPKRNPGGRHEADTVDGPTAYLMRDIAAITGTSCAAFMVLALDEISARTGAFAPKDWADPQAF